MKKNRFNSISYSSAAFNIAMLLLRVSFGAVLMVKHGFTKVMNFATLQHTFYNFLGMGPKFSLILLLVAEIFCSLLIVLGLFTRWACIPIIIAMIVVIFGNDAGKELLDSELALFYLTAFVVILFCGPGGISVDGMIGR